MRWYQEHKIAGIFGLAFALLVVVRLLSYQSATTLTRTSDETQQSQRSLGELSQTLGAIQGAETGQRGYLLAGADDYLKPYADAVQSIPDHLNQLDALLAFDP